MSYKGFCAVELWASRPFHWDWLTKYKTHFWRWTEILRHEAGYPFWGAVCSGHADVPCIVAWTEWWCGRQLWGMKNSRISYKHMANMEFLWKIHLTIYSNSVSHIQLQPDSTVNFLLLKTYRIMLDCVRVLSYNWNTKMIFILHIQVEDIFNSKFLQSLQQLHKFFEPINVYEWYVLKDFRLSCRKRKQ